MAVETEGVALDVILQSVGLVVVNGTALDVVLQGEGAAIANGVALDVVLQSEGAAIANGVALDVVLRAADPVRGILGDNARGRRGLLSASRRNINRLQDFTT